MKMFRVLQTNIEQLEERARTVVANEKSAMVEGADGALQPVVDEDGDAVLEQVFSVDTGTVLTINTTTKKLLSEDGVQRAWDFCGA